MRLRVSKSSPILTHVFLERLHLFASRHPQSRSDMPVAVPLLATQIAAPLIKLLVRRVWFY